MYSIDVSDTLAMRDRRAFGFRRRLDLDDASQVIHKNEQSLRHRINVRAYPVSAATNRLYRRTP